MDINFLSEISFANTFSHLVGCLFILSVVYFTVQKCAFIFFNLIKSHLFIFAFVSLVFKKKKKIQNNIARTLSESVLLMFSSGIFMVSGLTYSSFIYGDVFCLLCCALISHGFICVLYSI